MNTVTQDEIMTKAKRLVCYARVSTKLQEDNSSIKTQIDRMAAYCKAYNYQIVGTETDVMSGGKLERDGLQAAIKTVIEDGAADGLIVCYLDRFARNTKHFLELVELFEKHGKTLIFMDVQVDTSSSTGRCVLTVLMAMAQMMREQTKEKSKAACDYLKSNGKYAGGQPPYGWTGKRDKSGKPLNELEPLPTEQAVLLEILRMDGEDYTPTEIADELNRRGLPTRHGGQWHTKQISRILERASALQ